MAVVIGVNDSSMEGRVEFSSSSAISGLAAGDTWRGLFLGDLEAHLGKPRVCRGGLSSGPIGSGEAALEVMVMNEDASSAMLLFLNRFTGTLDRRLNVLPSLLESEIGFSCAGISGSVWTVSGCSDAAVPVGEADACVGEDIAMSGIGSPDVVIRRASGSGRGSGSALGRTSVSGVGLRLSDETRRANGSGSNSGEGLTRSSDSGGGLMLSLEYTEGASS